MVLLITVALTMTAVLLGAAVIVAVLWLFGVEAPFSISMTTAAIALWAAVLLHIARKP